MSTIGLGTLVFGYIVFAQMALSYPTGNLLPGRLAWVYVFVLGYLAQAIQNVVNMLFYDARGCPFCPPPHAPTLIHVGSPPFSLETWNNAWIDLHHVHPPDRGLPALAGIRAGRRGRAAFDRAGGRDGHVHQLHVLDLLAMSSSPTGSRPSRRCHGCRPPASWQQR